jgi:hypothetical protein
VLVNVNVGSQNELQHWWRDNDDHNLTWHEGNNGKPVVNPTEINVSLGSW